jgi:hypothetical protein
MMTREQIESILERVRSWPPARQEDAALMLLAMEAQDADLNRLSVEEREDLTSALEELARGELASEEEVEAVFSRYRA